MPFSHMMPGYAVVLGKLRRAEARTQRRLAEEEPCSPCAPRKGPHTAHNQHPRESHNEEDRNPAPTGISLRALNIQLTLGETNSKT